MRKNISEIKAGAILSYFLIIASTVYGFLIAPFILRQLGIGDYGVLKTVAALSSSLALIDLGIGSTVMRYTAKYHAEGKKESINNFLGMAMVECAILSVVIILASSLVILNFQNFYRSTFTLEQIRVSQILLSILTITVVAQMFENVLFSAISGSERFIFGNGVKLLLIVARIIFIFALLPIIKSAIYLVLLDLLLTVTTIAIEYVYLTRKLTIHIQLKIWDKPVFRESFGYTILMFLQMVTIQFNGNIDSIMIGAMMGTVFVAIYSFSIQIFGMFQQLSGAFANLFLPRISKMLHDECGSDLIQRQVERVGRYQFALMGAALTGFIVLGKDFFELWLGNGFEDCYALVLILTVPVLPPLIQNVCLSVLRAKKQMKFRTISLAYSAIVNLVITWIGIKLWGYWGAAIGTAASTIINFISMNIYYHVKLDFKIFSMFRNITKRTWLCLMAATALTFLFHDYVSGGWLQFVLNVMVFLLIYGISMLVFGLSGDERQEILGRYLFKNRS